MNAGSLPTTLHLMRLSSSLASSRHSACGLFQCSFIGKFEHILSHCVHSLFTVYPSLNDSYAQKTLLSCSLCIFSFPFVFPFFLPLFFQSNWEWSKHNQPISATSRGTVNPCRSQGSPAKFGAFQFSLFFAREKGCKLACRGVCLCWLQETDALQEFWKQTRLTLFSWPWLLFSPLFRRYKQNPFKSYRLAFLL